MLEIDRPSIVLRSGIYAWKEILVRTNADKVIIFHGDPIIVPVMVEDKAGNEQYGLVKEYILQKYRIGELVAYKEPGTNHIHIGFSLVHPIDSKSYQKDVGVSLALQIADNSWESVPAVPIKARESVAYFADRCTRYWKEAGLPAWAEQLMEDYVCESFEGK